MSPAPRRPLRVGLVCPYALDVPGGVQAQVLGLAAHLGGAGHDVRVLAPGGLPEDAHGLDPARFASAGAALGVRYNGSVAPVAPGPLALARTRRWVAAQAVDLLHVHEPLAPSTSLHALRAARSPVVATFHTATPRSRALRLAGTALAGAVDRIDAGVAVSPTARAVVAAHLDRDTVVVPNGLDVAAYAPGERVPGRDGPPRLLFLGRTDEPRKGLDVLLAALPALRREHPGLEVLVAGPGRRTLPEGCRALGLVSEDEKRALLHAVDAFVAPHTARESFGIVVLEAMAAGTPVVASDLTPFVDLLGGAADPAGWVFARGDASDLARAASAALGEGRGNRTARAQALAQRFDWSVVGPQLVEVYAGVLAHASAEGAS
ncbi:Phosphatidylinositol alpha-mannosyltransferase [Microlunatus sagamiharensis]|uniref:Phosphatidylinositol alpha-mannosyltransferase n=1 Tax=Microlunatus sagamiharensis TaxID=546874 RepID=A0A1H2M341_9ACTN|nr:glycosyltransferase family 4 protein [Microlunatus sagamiharensis]SDU87425.1 Phosphatidylinositol alpha-mannosyltransferase [Microlunatus sagamiharensis]